jgi:hypothetical protein
MVLKAVGGAVTSMMWNWEWLDKFGVRICKCLMLGKRVIAT